jgi:acylphosphatase
VSRLHVWVKGLVQGVFFRDSTRQEAERHRLAGWVRNLPDGRVEAVFQGERPACERALDFVHRGPRSARVEKVEFQWDEEEEGLTGFEVRY